MLLVAGCAGPECKVVDCDEFAGNLASNGKQFTKCYEGVSPIRTTLEDEDGDTFYDCTDGRQETCTEATVDAEFAYCEVRFR